MRLEYFLLIDRIVELKLDDHDDPLWKPIVPTTSTIFEGHFPGYPLMPGVLLIETMAQTSGWLLIALRKFTRMPFFAAVKERSCAPSSSRAKLAVSAKLCTTARGSRVTEAEITADGKAVCNAELTFRLVEFPSPEFRASMEKYRRRDRIPEGSDGDG